MPLKTPIPPHAWHLLTRLGEAQVLLPATLLAVVMLWRRPDARSLAAWWMALLGAAAGLAVASKIAFIGWGIGWAEFDFTGMSGHAVFSAAIFPLLMGVLASNAPRAFRYLAVAAGCVLALLIGLSRLVLGAHSVSEVLIGWLVGGAATAAVLALARLPGDATDPLVVIVAALWLIFMPVHAPNSRTQALLTRVSLMLSGHKTPYTRRMMQRELQRLHRHAPDSKSDARRQPVALAAL